MYNLSVCMDTKCMQMPLQTRRGHCISGTGVTGGFLSCLSGCLESNLGLLQEWQVFLSIDPQTKAEMILKWITRRLLGVEGLKLQTKDGKGYLQRSMWKKAALCHTSIVWGHFQTASVENNTRQNSTGVDQSMEHSEYWDIFLEKVTYSTSEQTHLKTLLLHAMGESVIIDVGSLVWICLEV